MTSGKGQIDLANQLLKEIRGRREKMREYGEFVDLEGADIWLQKNTEWIKGKLPVIPSTEVEMKILDEENTLSGRTRIEKKKDVRVKITIFVSKNVLTRKNIQQAIKAVLIHEFCHVVSPSRSRQSYGNILSTGLGGVEEGSGLQGIKLRRKNLRG